MSASQGVVSGWASRSKSGSGSGDAARSEATRSEAYSADTFEAVVEEEEEASVSCKGSYGRSFFYFVAFRPDYYWGIIVNIKLYF